MSQAELLDDLEAKIAQLQRQGDHVNQKTLQHWLQQPQYSETDLTGVDDIKQLMRTLLLDERIDAVRWLSSSKVFLRDRDLLLEECLLKELMTAVTWLSVSSAKPKRLNELLDQCLEKQLADACDWLVAYHARPSSEDKYDALRTLLRDSNSLKEKVVEISLKEAAKLEANGAKVLHKDELLSYHVFQEQFDVADWLVQRGAKLPTRRKLLARALERQMMPVAEWLYNYGVTLTLPHAVLETRLLYTHFTAADWLITKYDKEELLEDCLLKDAPYLTHPFPKAPDYLDEKGTEIADIDDLLEKCTAAGRLDSMEWLVTRGATLRRKDGLMAQALMDNRFDVADWLEARGAKASNGDVLLEHYCCLFPPQEQELQWVKDYESHKGDEVSGSSFFFQFQERQLNYLICGGATIQRNAVLLVLLWKRDGDNSPEVLKQALDCSRDELNHILTSRGAKRTPPIVFDILSGRLSVLKHRNNNATQQELLQHLETQRDELDTVISSGSPQLPDLQLPSIKSSNSTQHTSSDLALRSHYISAALDFSKTAEQELTMTDLSDDEFTFILHFLSRHPSHVQWDKTTVTEERLLDIADYYLIPDLRDAIEGDDRPKDPGSLELPDFPPIGKHPQTHLL